MKRIHKSSFRRKKMAAAAETTTPRKAEETPTETNSSEQPSGSGDGRDTAAFDDFYQEVGYGLLTFIFL
jgi:hypothetical protein